MNFALLISGNLGLQIINELLPKKNIVFVMTDSNSLDIKNLCSENKIPCFSGNPRNGRATEFLKNKNCDIILSINYLFIIEKEIIQLPTKYAINFHGSLLPKYRGRTPHVWAIINNEVKTGITAHLIDEGCDTGDIVEQMELEIGDYDTGANILKKFNNHYWDLIQSVLLKIDTDTLKTVKQDHTKATYFGKRTPEDGLIQWHWQKERIRNWVRAQANPYPGAFVLSDGEKITVDEISFVDDGFTDTMLNGQVTSIDPLKIKTQNGIIQVDKSRGEIKKIFINSILK